MTSGNIPSVQELILSGGYRQLCTVILNVNITALICVHNHTNLEQVVPKNVFVNIANGDYSCNFRFGNWLKQITTNLYQLQRTRAKLVAQSSLLLVITVF
jgi:hypothetical protein